MFDYFNTFVVIPGEIDVLLFGLTMLVAELYNRTKIRVVFSFQRDIDRMKRNMSDFSKHVKKKNSQSIVLFGKRIFNLHHWTVGLALTAISGVVLNIHTLAISLGLIVHHLIRRKSYSKL